MTVPRTLRIASQGQSTVCPSRLLQVSKHLSDEPLATRAGPARPSSGRPRSTTNDRGRQTLKPQHAGQQQFDGQRCSSRSASITSTTSSRPQSVAAGHGPASVTPVAEAGPSANRLLTAGSRKRLATLGNRVALDAGVTWLWVSRVTRTEAWPSSVRPPSGARRAPAPSSPSRAADRGTRPGVGSGIPMLRRLVISKGYTLECL